MRDNGETGYYLAFTLDSQPFALPLEAVQRVVHAAEVTKVPQAPDIVTGIINYKGNILPIINISRRFHLPEKEIEPNHHFIIAHSKKQAFGLVAEHVAGVIKESMENLVPLDTIIAGVEFLAGVIKLSTGLMLIPDLDKILTRQEETALKDVLGKGNNEHIDEGKVIDAADEKGKSKVKGKVKAKGTGDGPGVPGKDKGKAKGKKKNA